VSSEPGAGQQGHHHGKEKEEKCKIKEQCKVKKEHNATKAK
jgi:hypothetical protein